MSTSSKNAETKPGRAGDRPESVPALRKLLVPLDFSERSVQALNYAAPLALRLGASLCLVHVVETASYLHDLSNVALAMSEAEMLNKAKLKLARLARRWTAQGLAVECQVRSGRAFQEVSVLARDVGADLIVISTHGYTGFKKALLGSTTERVVSHAPCPVLVLRQKVQEQAPADAGEAP